MAQRELAAAAEEVGGVSLLLEFPVASGQFPVQVAAAAEGGGRRRQGRSPQTAVSSPGNGRSLSQGSTCSYSKQVAKMAAAEGEGVCRCHCRKSHQSPVSSLQLKTKP
ncbi:MAG TPA: hypothetical protein VHO69_01185 [Phototrophicaceae bacterium]|nr:hypothetical protein [Phototrophicaceae bacterium]